MINFSSSLIISFVLALLGLVPVAGAQVVPAQPPPTSQTVTVARNNTFFVNAFTDYVFNYNTNANSVSGLQSSHADGWGGGGSIGSLDDKQGFYLRAEYFPGISVPGDSGVSLRTTRLDVEIHGLLGSTWKQTGLNVMGDFAFKFSNIDDRLSFVSGGSDDRSQQLYLGSMGLDYDLPIGPFSIFGTANGMGGYGVVNDDAIAFAGTANGWAYGWGASAGVSLRLFDNNLRISAGYKIQQIFVYGRTTNQFGNTSDGNIASDELQGLFLQLTYKF